jgi:hypothetical protein
MAARYFKRRRTAPAGDMSAGRVLTESLTRERNSFKTLTITIQDDKF